MLEQLEKIKARLGITDTSMDERLIQLLEDTEAEILDYCNRDTLVTGLLGLQREMVISCYNKMGSEGEASRSEGGVSVSYVTEIPETIKSRLNSYRLLKAVRIANAVEV